MRCDKYLESGERSREGGGSGTGAERARVQSGFYIIILPLDQILCAGFQQSSELSGW